MDSPDETGKAKILPRQPAPPQAPPRRV